jgi:serine protease Do
VKHLTKIAICFLVVSVIFSVGFFRHINTNFFDELQDRVVVIEDKYGTGSGVIVDKNIILTAGHMVFEDVNYTITFHDGVSISSKIGFKSEIDDVGMIVIPINTEFGLMEFADSNNVKVGDTVYACGHPFGYMTWMVTKGIVSRLRTSIDFFGKNLVFISDAPTFCGNSGGPVVNTRGNLIGIVVGGMGGYDSFTVITSSNICKRFIEKIKNQVEIH